MRTKLRSKFTLFFIVCAALLAFPAMASALEADPSGSTSLSPTIQSDEADYRPGATVTLTGSNWQPGEAVHINVNDDQGKTWSRDTDVTADASGNISDSFNLPDWFVATYKVTATGQQSGVVTTSFTDGDINVKANLPTGHTWTVTWERYSTSENCIPTGGQTGPATSGSRTISANTVTGTTNSSGTNPLLTGANAGQSVKLIASATSTTSP